MRATSTPLLFCAVLTMATYAQAPSFRASIDYVELDVFVTDENGAFVKDLAATDFEILEDGRPQTVERLSFVDIPIVPAPSPTAGAPPFELDTATNAGADVGRLWVMLLDAPSDRSRGAAYTRRTQNAARQFVEQALGPNDQMAVIHVQGTMQASQPFTRSRTRLLGAVASFTRGVASGGPDVQNVPGIPPFEQITRTRATFQVIRDVSQSLGEMSGRRKAILWVGGQMPFDLQNVAPSLLFEYRDTIRAAQRNNVVIYPVDPSGLGNNLSYQGSLKIIAEDTGGAAVTNTNDFRRGFESIVRDHSTYYLLGYYPDQAHRDGQFHEVTVRVKRQGVTVRARRGYVAAQPLEAERPATTSAPEGLNDALRNPILRTGLLIDVSATPFGGQALAGSVLVAATVRSPGASSVEGPLSIGYRVINDTGKTILERASEQSPVAAAAPGDGRSLDGTRVVDRLDLPKGRNEIRLAVRRADGITGSVVTYVDVPDFTSGRVAMSGLVLESGIPSSPVVSGAGASAGDAAVTPARAFDRDARVLAAGVLYRRADVPWARITLSAELRDAAAKAVRRDVEAVWRSAEASSLERGFSIELPLADLAEGGYVLSVNARVDEGRRPAVSRDVPFRVTP